MRVLPILIAATLGACVPQPNAPSSEPGASAGDSQRAEAYDLSGEWTVSRLDGESLSVRIPFSGSAEALTWQPACAGQDIHYRTRGDMIEFYQPPRDGLQAVCEIGYPAELPRVIEALQGRWEVAERDDGNLLLTRGETRLQLEQPSSDPQVSLAGEWRVAGVNGEDFDEPYGIALSADGEEIWWNPSCAWQSVRYTISGTRFRMIPPPEVPQEPLYVCAIAVPPRLPEIMETIRGADRIERTPANGIRLSGNGRSLTLFGQ